MTAMAYPREVKVADLRGAAIPFRSAWDLTKVFDRAVLLGDRKMTSLSRVIAISVPAIGSRLPILIQKPYAWDERRVIGSIKLVDLDAGSIAPMAHLFRRKPLKSAR